MKTGVESAADVNGSLSGAADTTKSHYGAKNHFLIENRLKETAKRYGISIKQQEKGRFAVRSSYGPEALDKLISPFHHQDITSGWVDLDRKSLKQFLNFLHQPVSSTLGKNQKRMGHSVLRFATTGRVEIPDFIDQDLNDSKSLACHEKGEHKMKEDDVWATESEFWNPKEVIESERSQIVSSIPGTTYDPEKGFVLNIDPKLVPGEGSVGVAQEKLTDEFWSILNQVTENRYHSQTGNEITLSANELQNFLNLCAESSEIESLIKRAQIEEKAQAKLEAISEQADSLRTDPRFQIATAAKETTIPVEDKFENLRYAATSCLTPIVETKAMLDAWKLSNFTEHVMGLSEPIDRVLEEYAVMKMAIDHMVEEGKQSPADLQAMVNKFRPLLSFSRELAEAIEVAHEANKNKFIKRHGEESLNRLSQQMSDLQTVFEQASVNGVSAGELSSDHKEIIESVKNVFGQNGNMVTQGATGYFKMMKDFWVSAAQSAGDNPTVFGVMAGLITYAWWMKYGVDAQLAKETIEPIINSGGFFEPIGDTALSAESFKEAGEVATQAAIDSGEVDECIVREDCHYNKLLPDPVMNLLDEGAKKYLQFRHWVGKDIIASNAMTAQTFPTSLIDSGYTASGIAVNETPTFTSVSESVTNAGGELVVDANMFQDSSHAAMLGYGFSRIALRGLRGFKQMTSLAAEFINPAACMANRNLSFAKRNGLKAAATTLAWTGRHDAAEKVAGHISVSHRDRFMNEFVKISKGDHKFSLDKDKPKPQEKPDIDAVNVKLGLWAYGMGKEAVTIGPGNIKDLQLALNEFGLTLDYSSEDVGIVKDKHKSFLREKFQNVEKAVNAYLDSPDHENSQHLQKTLEANLQHILGAELQYADSGKIYAALFPESSQNLEKGRQALLKRTAAKKEGRINRAHYRQKKWQQASEVENRFQKPEKLASLQSLKYAWGAVAAPVKKARLRTLGALSYAGDAIVFAAREGVQEPIAQMPHKKAFATAVGAGSIIALPLDMAANINSSLVDAFSATGATITSVASTGVIAALLNLPQDLGLHTAAVYTSGTLGLLWYAASKRVIKPGFQAIQEQVNHFSPRSA